MCGRYVQVSSPRLLAERFGVDETAIEAREPDYNVAPRATVPVVVRRDERTVLEPMRWGLVPSWAKDVKIGDRLINARAETLADKSAFKRAFARRRCLIPVDGFYEWKVVPGRRRKQPVLIRAADGQPFAFAGLWEAWKPRDQPDADWLTSCVIVTTRPNALLAPVHDRMPVVLAEGAWSTWLDPSAHDPAALRTLLVPAPDDALVLHPVGLAVNNPRNHGPDLVEPVEENAGAG